MSDAPLVFGAARGRNAGQKGGRIGADGNRIVGKTETVLCRITLNANGDSCITVRHVVNSLLFHVTFIDQCLWKNYTI